MPRPIFLILISALTAVVALACAFATLPALIPAAVLAGLAFGAHWSLIPALASELFGLRFFASNYCLLQVNHLRIPVAALCCQGQEPVKAELCYQVMHSLYESDGTIGR